MATRTILGAVLLAACVDAPSLDSTDQAVESTNGVSLNGVSLNGVSLNGVSLNGVSLNGVSLNGVSLNGVSLNGVSLNGVSLNGVSLNGSSLTGVRSDTGETITVDAIGRTLVGTLSNGATIELVVDHATRLDGANKDTWSYDISYASDTGIHALCPSGALAVSGTWDATAAYAPSATQFTFACRGTSVAKCVELGYKPWLGLATYMQSCVRMLRGDYCGTGVSYTQTGHRVNLFDNLGVQTDTEQWMPEAEWTPNGASCVSTDVATRYDTYGTPKPDCLSTFQLRVTRGCGQSLRFGALLISETPIETAVAPTSIKLGTTK